MHTQHEGFEGIFLSQDDNQSAIKLWGERLGWKEKGLGVMEEWEVARGGSAGVGYGVFR